MDRHVAYGVRALHLYFKLLLFIYFSYISYYFLLLFRYLLTPLKRTAAYQYSHRNGKLTHLPLSAAAAKG